MEITESIWLEYKAKLTIFIRKHVNGDLAEDLLQEVFIKVHLHIGSLKDQTKLESWLYQITRNVITDFYRKHKENAPLPDWLEQETPEPTEVIRQELAHCLTPMIQQLPDKYRQAVYLSEIENKGQKDIAESEGISISGAKSRVQRGRALLKEHFDACCDFELNSNNQVISYTKKKI